MNGQRGRPARGRRTCVSGLTTLLLGLSRNRITFFSYIYTINTSPMKTNLHKLLFIAVSLTAAALFVVSCKKEAPYSPPNPPTEIISPAPFTLTAVETRGDRELPWTISKAGVTDSVEEELDDMYVTLSSSFVVTVVPDNETDFPGFNVRSSDTNAVKVTVIDNRTFKLEHIFASVNPVATIEVWNGSGSSEFKISFQVYSTHRIIPTGFIFMVDGKRIELPLYDSMAEADQNAVTILSIPESEKDPNTDVIHKVVFHGIVPENATCSQVEAGTLIVNECWVNWLKEHGKDFTFYGHYYDGSYGEFLEHNIVYTCLRDGGIVATEFEGPIRIMLLTSGAANQKFCSVYIVYPFASMDEELEWIEQNWY